MAANAPADPSGQDRQVAAKAAAIAAKARSEINREDESESESESSELKATVAKGTPIIESVSREDEELDPNKNGVLSVLAAVKELQIQNLIPAA